MKKCLQQESGRQTESERVFTAREGETDRQRVKEYLQQEGDSGGGGGGGRQRMKEYLQQERGRQTDRE